VLIDRGFIYHPPLPGYVFGSQEIHNSAVHPIVVEIVHMAVVEGYNVLLS
jgi:hypothetical protein